jgi:hypothetical protein
VLLSECVRFKLGSAAAEGGAAAKGSSPAAGHTKAVVASLVRGRALGGGGKSLGPMRGRLLARLRARCRVPCALQHGTYHARRGRQATCQHQRVAGAAPQHAYCNSIAVWQCAASGRIETWPLQPAQPPSTGRHAARGLPTLHPTCPPSTTLQAVYRCPPPPPAHPRGQHHAAPCMSR